MKTTSDEISKKLAELKFRSNQVWNQDGKFWGYDLETLLEVLPNHYPCQEDGGDLFFQMTKTWMGYVCCPDGERHPETIDVVKGSVNDSLADMSARLLILLREKGLISFMEGV